MSNLGSHIIYKQLLDRHGRIRIPIIQRDYAQGRPGEKEVREEFLSALEEALKKPADDQSLPLNLDFIYGSVEGKEETRFLPLDGQQRLTTLFLLHWYLAWADQQWDDFSQLFRANGHSRFSYSVRPSSNEFFDELVGYQPTNLPEELESLSRLITDQPWYFRSWRLDPTIQSALAMLDDIHRRFSSSKGLYSRLVDESLPAITFQLLDLNNFGLSDDLYIKMNARGKPLTPLETFKARYEQELEKLFSGKPMAMGSGNVTVAEFVARRMDTTWADLFWVYRDKESNLYDDAVMSVFQAVALITRNPENDNYEEDVDVLRKAVINRPSYADFHTNGWLDQEFTNTLISLLESWSGQGGSFAAKLPNERYFNEYLIFKKLANEDELSYVEVVQFAAYAMFIRSHRENLDQKAFQEWMRVVYNLSVNTSYDRPRDLRRSLGGLRELLPMSNSILNHFADFETPPGGFNEQQVAEEKFKAEVILGHPDWRPLIDQAEAHGYFKGQIEFLFDFCGALAENEERMVKEWDDELHRSFQKAFEIYWKKADSMFSQNGLTYIEGYRWQRALLSMGDYLLPRGRNYSFLVNSSTDQASWKRLLRGTGSKVSDARKILHTLWDRLDITISLDGQLDYIISIAPTMESWREHLVKTPNAITYCEARSIRLYSDERVYLLKKTQMNGAHAELFSYCLYQTLLGEWDKSSSLELRGYCDVSGTEFEPYIEMILRQYGSCTIVRIYFTGGRFRLAVDTNQNDIHREVLAKLVSLGFQENGRQLSKESARECIKNTLKDLAIAFDATSYNELSHA